MLKKAGFVAAAATGLTMLGGTAFAAEQEAPTPSDPDAASTFSDAYQDFVSGGGAAGHGVASLVAGAYKGIALTPELVADNLDASDRGSFSGLLPDDTLTPKNGILPENELLPEGNLLPGNGLAPGNGLVR